MCFPYVLQTIYNGTDRRRGDQDIPAGQVLCRGSWVCLWVYSNRFAALCRALGLEDCLTDPRFAEVPERAEELAGLLRPRAGAASPTATRTTSSPSCRRSTSFRRAPTARRRSAQARHLAARGYWRRIGDRRRTSYVLPGPPFQHEPHAGARAGGGKMPMLPLEGIRVVELTTAWAGPMAGRVLAWYGAESFHVESPTRTNTWRSNRDEPNPLTYPDLEPGRAAVGPLLHVQLAEREQALAGGRPEEPARHLRSCAGWSPCRTC